MVRAANERTPLFYVGCVGWIAICAILLVLDLGVLAFCGSVFLAIWVFGLREKFSNETTASAYSVFNKDQKAIVGGFTASQFERQMRGHGNHPDGDNPVRGTVASIAEVTSSDDSVKLKGDERLRQRKAAAAAAEKRYQQQRTPEDTTAG